MTINLDGNGNDWYRWFHLRGRARLLVAWPGRPTWAPEFQSNADHVFCAAGPCFVVWVR